MGEEVDIHSRPKDSSPWDKNESTEECQSATQKPMSYTFTIPGKKEKLIQIIDTPGIGDTRGISYDERNFEEIISYIADYPKIHAILFLVAPNESKLKVSFRYGFQELLGRLHRTAVDNVIFCFTKSRGNQFKAGASYSTLQTLLTKLGTDGPIVPLHRQTSYFFDSESFRYLAAIENGFEFTDDDHRYNKESWDQAVIETRRLFKHIFTLEPHNVNKTLSVNNTKKVIPMLSKPLGEITKNILTNECLLKDKKSEIEHLSVEGENLKDKLFVEQITLESEKLSSPQTVCAAQCCVDHGTVGGKPHTTIYKTVCDPDCAHTEIETGMMANPNLSDCKAFENGICKKCGCSWEFHMHITARTKEVTVVVLNDTTLTNLSANLTKQDEVNFFIKMLEGKIGKHADQKQIIRDNCAEFAVFAAQNSLLAVNDAYNDYLKYLIKEEREKSDACRSTILEELENYTYAYEEQCKLLTEASKEKRSKRTVDEINKMVNDLKEKDLCGKFLEEIQYFQTVSVRVSAQNRSKKIVLTNWKETMKWIEDVAVDRIKNVFN